MPVGEALPPGSEDDMVELTVKEVADLERVHERTVRLWVAAGRVPSRRTPGGQIRIPYARSHVAVLRLHDSGNDQNLHK